MNSTDNETETVPVNISDLLALERVLREIPGNLLISEAESLNRLMAAIPMEAFERSRQPEEQLMVDDNTETDEQDDETGLKVFFNPFAYTIEENNEFLRLGYEPIPIRIPTTRPRDK